MTPTPSLGLVGPGTAAPGAPAGSGAVPAAGSAPQQAAAYDFRRPTKVSREHLRALQLAFETAARQLTTLLTSGLRQVCHVQVGEVSQRSYDDHVAGMDSPSVTVPLGIAPLAGTGTLHFSLPAALAAIDHMLGGPGGTQPNRTLTDIEVPLLHSLLEQMLSVLRYALEPIVALDLSFGAIEYNPQFVQAAGAADAVLVGEFVLHIGEQTSPLLVSLPLAPMLPVLAALHAHEDAAPVEPAEVGARLGSVPMELTVRFAPLTMSPAQVLALQLGDIVRLPHHVAEPLTVTAGDTGYALAVAGRTGTRLAALVVAGTPLPAPHRRSTP